MSRRLPQLILPRSGECITTERLYHKTGCFSIYKFKP